MFLTLIRSDTHDTVHCTYDYALYTLFLNLVRIGTLDTVQCTYDSTLKKNVTFSSKK